MRSRWQFKVVLEARSFFVKRNGSRRILEGTDGEAIEFAARVHAHFADREAKHVEAWSDGEVDFSVPDSGWERVQFRLCRQAGVWRFAETRLMHPALFTAVEDAVEYAAFRGRGCCCEIRVINGEGRIENVVLFQAGCDPFRKAAANCARNACR